MYESLHPYWARSLGEERGYRGGGGVDYTEEVTFPGAKALRIRFDPLCCSEADPRKAQLIFTKDDGRTIVATVGGPSDKWKSFVIHADRFKFRFRAHTDQKNPGWGYKFTVSPLLGLSWSSESQVLSEPSLEYACWILDFLLSRTIPDDLSSGSSGGSGGGGASSAASSLTSSTKEEDDATSSLRVRRAVCTADVFEALANYLRSPGAPYKRRGTFGLCFLKMILFFLLLYLYHQIFISTVQLSYIYILLNFFMDTLVFSHFLHNINFFIGYSFSFFLFFFFYFFSFFK